MSKFQQAGGMEASREIVQVPTYCADDVKAFCRSTFVLLFGVSSRAEANAGTRD